VDLQMSSLGRLVVSLIRALHVICSSYLNGRLLHDSTYQNAQFCVCDVMYLLVIAVGLIGISFWPKYAFDGFTITCIAVTCLFVYTSFYDICCVQ
jgi:hypothetical protein